MEAVQAQPRRCWCGEDALQPFSAKYLRCARCETLVALAPAATTTIRDERSDLYGLNYFVEHARELGHPDLFARSRSDLSERCAFWLRALLRRRPPPARVLELGCANGAFVGLLATAGYDATGLDLSPALTAYVSKSFGVPVLTGTLEAQHLPARSVDVLVMMDVLEHLADPLGTLVEVGRVLAPDGLILVQTPNYPPACSHDDLVARCDPFLEQLKPLEHLFLLSAKSVRDMLARAGFEHLEFEPAIFEEYDQFFAASRLPLPVRTDATAALERSPGGRVVEALLDACERADSLDAAARDLRHHVDDIEKDRAARLDVIHQQQGEIAGNQSQLQALQEEVARLTLVKTEYQGLVRRLGPLRRVFGLRSQKSGTVKPGGPLP